MTFQTRSENLNVNKMEQVCCSFQNESLRKKLKIFKKKMEEGKGENEMRRNGFVYLHEVDPTIKLSLRYFSKENFIGELIEGYKKQVCIMTRQAAESLKKVQSELKKEGYCIVVYDSYRPQKAVDMFVRWSKDFEDQKMKDYYYPRVAKERTFELGYIAERSGHTRGSTVDMSIIEGLFCTLCDL